VREDPSVRQLELAERSKWLRPSLCRRTWIEESLTAQAFAVVWHMAMSVDDEVRARKPSGKPSGPTNSGSAVMEHRDVNTLETETQLLRDYARERGVVVAKHALHGHESSQLREGRERGDIAGMEQEVRRVDRPEQCRGQPRCNAAIEMGVGDHDEVHVRTLSISRPRRSLAASALPNMRRDERRRGVSALERPY
jgi:hypothetical protein